MSPPLGHSSVFPGQRTAIFLLAQVMMLMLMIIDSPDVKKRNFFYYHFALTLSSPTGTTQSALAPSDKSTSPPLPAQFGIDGWMLAFAPLFALAMYERGAGIVSNDPRASIKDVLFFSRVAVSMSAAAMLNRYDVPETPWQYMWIAVFLVASVCHSIVLLVYESRPALAFASLGSFCASAAWFIFHGNVHVFLAFAPWVAALLESTVRVFSTTSFLAPNVFPGTKRRAVAHVLMTAGVLFAMFDWPHRSDLVFATCVPMGIAAALIALSPHPVSPPVRPQSHLQI